MGTPARWLLLLVLVGACGEDAPSYDGTVVVGADYVQALVTAPGDPGCPPRVQRPGLCVRTPTGSGTCADEPACVTGVAVFDGAGDELAAGASSFVRVPALASADLAGISIEVTGCGGTLTQELTLGEPVAPFAEATATVGPETIEVSWMPTGAADLVCALWIEPDHREVCCDEDSGAMSLSLEPGAQVQDVFLSRGRLLRRRSTSTGAVEFFRTAETDTLLP